MDLIIFLLLLALVVFLLRDIKWVTYLIGIIEIFLRLVHYIANHLGIPEVATFVNNNLPGSIFDILAPFFVILKVFDCIVLPI